MRRPKRSKAIPSTSPLPSSLTTWQPRRSDVAAAKRERRFVSGLFFPPLSRCAGRPDLALDHERPGQLPNRVPTQGRGNRGTPQADPATDPLRRSTRRPSNFARAGDDLWRRRSREEDSSRIPAAGHSKPSRASMDGDRSRRAYVPTRAPMHGRESVPDRYSHWSLGATIDNLGAPQKPIGKPSDLPSGKEFFSAEGDTAAPQVSLTPAT